VLGIYTFVNRDRLAAADASRARLRPTDPPGPAPLNILKDERRSQLEFLNRALADHPVAGVIETQLERAGMGRSVGEFVLASVMLAAIGLLIGKQFGGILLGIVAGLVGLAIPYLVVRRKQKKRAKKFEEQLAEAVEMIVTAMRAGYSFQAAMKFVGEELSAPLGPEFTRFYDEQRLGVDVRRALLDLQNRIGTLDAKMFVTALIIQRESGGNLSEVLTNLTTLIRDRVALHGQIDTLTAEPKMGARILACLPVIVFFLMAAVNREFMNVMLVTPGGRMGLMYAAASVVLGYVVLMKIADIEV
jgi:tight adherence protein B